MKRFSQSFRTIFRYFLGMGLLLTLAVAFHPEYRYQFLSLVSVQNSAVHYNKAIESFKGPSSPLFWVQLDGAISSDDVADYMPLFADVTALFIQNQQAFRYLDHGFFLENLDVYLGREQPRFAQLYPEMFSVGRLLKLLYFNGRYAQFHNDTEVAVLTYLKLLRFSWQLLADQNLAHQGLAYSIGAKSLDALFDLVVSGKLSRVQYEMIHKFFESYDMNRFNISEQISRVKREFIGMIGEMSDQVFIDFSVLGTAEVYIFQKQLSRYAKVYDKRYIRPIELYLDSGRTGYLGRAALLNEQLKHFALPGMYRSPRDIITAYNADISNAFHIQSRRYYSTLSTGAVTTLLASILAVDLSEVLQDARQCDGLLKRLPFIVNQRLERLNIIRKNNG